MSDAGDEADRFEGRLAALTGNTPPIIWVADGAGQWIWSNPSWTAYTGLSTNASQGRGWAAAIAPDDRALVEAAWRVAPSRGMFDVEHRLIQQSSGETRRFHSYGTPLPAVPGQMQEWLGTCTDVHAARQIEQRGDLLLAELQGRVADVLALVRLMLRQAPKTGGSAENFALRFESRLDAVARTQAMLTRRLGAGLDLGQLIAEEELVHAAHESGQVQAGGPAVLLLGRAASMFGLVLHELMENSVQHGALATPAGRISVTWQVETNGLLRFEWLEVGLTLPDGPRRRGFGSDLIERLLPRELGGMASLDFRRDSVRCIIVLRPADSGVTTSQD